MGIFDEVTTQVTKQMNKKYNKHDTLLNQLPKNEYEVIERRQQSEHLINNKALISSAVGVLPIPGLDIGVDIRLMTDIIEQINRIYGLSHKQVDNMADDAKKKVMFTVAKKGGDFVGKKLTTNLVSSIIKTIAKREVLKQSKWVPIIGQAVSGTISYFMMKKLGEAHIKKCEDIARDLITQTK